MKYFRRVSVTAIILTVLCFAISSEVKAAGAEDLKKKWYETHYYPINPESDEWFDYGLEEMFDILNPPEDLLHSFSTEELAKLMMDYPYLWVLTSYEYDKMDIFWTYIENCAIYNELMSRDDGVLCLLKEYRNSDFDVNVYNEEPYMVFGYNPMANAEVFGCQFIVHNMKNFDKEEYELCRQVMREKEVLYSALNDNVAKMYLSFVREQPVMRIVTAEEVKERWYETRYYPYTSFREDWQRDDESYTFTLEVMNPPLDLLISMSTEELAELMQEYPLMGQITYYFDADGKQDYEAFFTFLEANCDIFYELLRREDGISCLLQKYRTNEYVNSLINNVYTVVDINKLWLAELFGCQFIRYYAHQFTDSEYELVSQIIEKKRKQYSQDYRLSHYLELPEIEPPGGEEKSKIRTNYLSPEEIEEKESKLAAAQHQMQLKENSLHTVTAGTEDSNTAKQEENNGSLSGADGKTSVENGETAENDKTSNGIDTVAADDDKTYDKDDKADAEELMAAAESARNKSQQIAIIIVSAVIAVTSVIAGVVLVRQRRKGKMKE